MSLTSRAFRLLLACLLAGPLPLSPATITVGGGCTLPDAITAANTDAAVGGCSAGSGTDTLVLTADVTLAVIDNGDNGLPQVASAIGVEGNGFTIQRHPAAPDFRLFEVLTNGTLRLEEVILSSGSVYDDGGAILNRGYLLLEESRVDGSYGIEGGAIANKAGTTTLIDSTLSDNSALGYGGGLYTSYAATLSVSDSTISGNYAGWSGGGLFGYGGVSVTGSTISDNTSGGSGGGITLNYQTSTVADSLLANNTALVGGGVWNRQSANLILVNSTLSGNSGSGVGSYQAFGDGSTELINASVVDNSPYGIYVGGTETKVSLTNTLVAYNAAAGCAGEAPIDGGGNFDADGSCPGASPITGLDPALADNGGPTLTHALLSGSSAVDAGGACGLLTDQRRFGRDALCDSGAFELDAAPAVGGAVEGLSVQQGSCSNLSAGTRVSTGGQKAWNCRTDGLAIASGDRIRQGVRGRPNEPAVLGGVEGIGGGTVVCQNLATGQSVQFALAGETTWNCRERGLEFAPGDRVAWTAIGEAL